MCFFKLNLLRLKRFSKSNFIVFSLIVVKIVVFVFSVVSLFCFFGGLFLQVTCCS